MRRHYWPSMLVLRGRPKRRRFRLRTISASNRVRDERLEGLERALDRLMRERSELISGYLQAGVDKARVVGIEEEYRKITLQIQLNREEINGLRSREVPGYTARKKEMALELLYKVAEEMHDVPWLRTQVERLAVEVAALKARAVGEQPDA